MGFMSVSNEIYTARYTRYKKLIRHHMMANMHTYNGSLFTSYSPDSSLRAYSSTKSMFSSDMFYFHDEYTG